MVPGTEPGARPRVLLPIPRRDFDPSEVAVSWRVLTLLGNDVVFATPDGDRGAGDAIMLTGRGLDVWGLVPGLRSIPAVGLFLRADANARAAYAALERDDSFGAPLRWDRIDVGDVDGVLLPGGHRARGMREYLESEVLQEMVVEAFRREVPLAAVCHGVLLAARSIDPRTGRSVLHGRRTTALTWSLESRAWRIARRTRFWDPDYYRTYPDGPGQPPGHMSVQREVTRALARPQDFLDVPSDAPHARLMSSGRARDSFEDDRPAFVVQDDRYLSGRWPGDVHTLARRFSQILRTTADPPKPTTARAEG